MANLIKRDPFDELFRGFFVRPVDFGQAPAELPAIQVDVRETPETYTVHAELPGIAKDDVQVSIDGALVSISAERKQEKDVREGERLLRSERYFGKVSRSFQLAQDIDEARSSGKFKEGVLELTLAKKAATPTRRLTIS